QQPSRAIRAKRHERRRGLERRLRRRRPWFPGVKRTPNRRSPFHSPTKNFRFLHLLCSQTCSLYILAFLFICSALRLSFVDCRLLLHLPRLVSFLFLAMHTHTQITI